MFSIRVLTIMLAAGLAIGLSPAPVCAASYSVVYSFGSQDGDGSYPTAGLINVNGVLYGTTINGGANSLGTVFKLKAGAETTLHSFGYGNDGSQPYGGLINVGGTLYGTTTYGGEYCQQIGCGTVFKITTEGHEAVLHSFSGASGSLLGPLAGLINVGGALYGTTQAGGKYNGGTVFKIRTEGTRYEVLHSFGSGSDGANPIAGLIDVNGVLYGTTFGGGANGSGTVFKITKAGADYKVLHSFQGESDGAGPWAGLINAGGTLYGTTINGGTGTCCTVGLGTVFEITTEGHETVLYRFDGSHGANPYAGLIKVGGALYGTTLKGGSYDGGTVFKLTTGGVETVLYSFQGYPTDGTEPRADLVDVGGTLYGTTYYGGSGGCNQLIRGCGTVFKVTP